MDNERLQKAINKSMTLDKREANNLIIVILLVILAELSEDSLGKVIDKILD